MVPSYEKTTSATKPKVFNVSQHTQRRTEPRPQVTCKNNLVKIGLLVLELHEQTDKQTDRQTNIFITIFCTSPSRKAILKWVNANNLDEVGEVLQYADADFIQIIKEHVEHRQKITTGDVLADYQRQLVN